MVGREAYHNPMLMRSWDAEFYASHQPAVEYEDLVNQLFDYAHRQLANPAISLRHMARHYLGLMHGLPGARQWRRMLSDASLLKNNNASLIAEAWQAVKEGAANQSELI